LMGGVVGFEMTIARVEGKYKLSQNRSEADQYHVVEHLSQSSDSLAVETAALMRERQATKENS
jgi:transcriptional regulator